MVTAKLKEQAALNIKIKFSSSNIKKLQIPQATDNCMSKRTTQILYYPKDFQNPATIYFFF